jgi:hypothetical protein
VAAEHLAWRWLAPLLAAGPLPEDDAHDIVLAGYRLAKLAAPPLKAEMASWWAAAVVDPTHVHAGFGVPDLLVLLRGGGLRERPWLSALPDEFHGRPQPELAQMLVDEFGDDPERWEMYLAIAETFRGTVGELLDAVRAVCAAPVRT